MNKLDGLSPKFRARVEAALEYMAKDTELKSMGVKFIIVNEGLRELSRQMAYYSRGRMKTADVQEMFKAAKLWKLTDTEAQTVVTWTLQSKHLDGLAVDLVPSSDGKELWWNAPDEVWKRMAGIAASFGIEAGYNWQPPKQDKPHFQMREA